MTDCPRVVEVRLHNKHGRNTRRFVVQFEWERDGTPGIVIKNIFRRTASAEEPVLDRTSKFGRKICRRALRRISGARQYRFSEVMVA